MKITIKRKPPVETYRIGQVIQITSGPFEDKVFLIAQVECNCINLIGFVDGNRLNTQIKVNDVTRITKVELGALTGCPAFELVEAKLIIT